MPGAWQNWPSVVGDPAAVALSRSSCWRGAPSSGGLSWELNAGSEGVSHFCSVHWPRGSNGSTSRGQEAQRRPASRRELETGPGGSVPWEGHPSFLGAPLLPPWAPLLARLPSGPPVPGSRLWGNRIGLNTAFALCLVTSGTGIDSLVSFSLH